MNILDVGAMQAVCQLADQRLRLLEARFDLHSLVNTEYEKDAMRVRAPQPTYVRVPRSP
jgi:hypothetical protein